jgi:predicted DNA-binding transcriptional regulator YafY
MPAGRDQLKPMQRLVRIMAVLEQEGSVGATRDRLLAVADYGDADPGTQLGRDLNHLRNQGWEIENVGGEGEQARYRMLSVDNRLSLRLTAAQRAALQRAVILADRADLARSLGVAPASLPEAVGPQVVPSAAGPVVSDLSLALEAVRHGCRISFSYKGTRRVLDPATVRLQNHLWYLSGVEVGDDKVKHFVVTRMSETSLDRPGSADPVPEVRTIELHPLQWEVDPPVEVVVRAEADYVPDVERLLLAPDAAYARDGAVDMTYTVTNHAAFRARIYTLGPRVRVVGPASFRAALVAELREMVGR